MPDGKRQLSMVLDLNKCIGCQTCTISCKRLWTREDGMAYMWWNSVNTMPGRGTPRDWEQMGGGFRDSVAQAGKLPTGRDFGEIKAQLLQSLANGGQPIIEVTNGNFRNRGELVLTHRHDGQDLNLTRAYDTLVNLNRVWGRPVHIETLAEGKGRRLSYDGEKHEAEEL